MNSLNALNSYSLLLAGLIFSNSSAFATPSDKRVGKPVTYTSGSALMESYYAQTVFRTAKKGPAVLIVPNWLGLKEGDMKEADSFAKMGISALAVDVYGQGVRPKSTKEAGELAGKYKADRKLLRERITSALDYLKTQPFVDSSKIIVLGYCFGGTTALELARSGANIAGAVSFHGGLDSPTPADAANIKAKILVLHGNLDPFVPADEVSRFEKEMNDAKTDYQLIKYSGAVHSFTDVDAGSDMKTGAAYNPLVAARARQAFNQFFKELTGISIR